MTLRGCAGTVLAAVLVVSAAAPVAADGAGATAGPAPVAVAPAPVDRGAQTSDDAFVATVRTAVANRDLDYFEKHLIDWDGARKRTQRLTLFQIRECFGRPIKSAGLEPVKPDPGDPLVPDGFRTTLPVTHLLRIAFDEQHAADENPACVFMLSKDPKASYRMVLVLPTAPAPK